MNNSSKKSKIIIGIGMTSFVILTLFSLRLKQRIKEQQQKEKYNRLNGSMMVGYAQEQDRKNHPMFYLLSEKTVYFEVARFDGRGDEKDLTTILLIGDQKKAKEEFYKFLDTQNIDPLTQEFEFFEKDAYLNDLYRKDPLAKFLPVINNQDYQIYYNKNEEGSVVIYVTLYTEPYSETKQKVAELFKANNDDINKYTVKWQDQAGVLIYK